MTSAHAPLRSAVLDASVVVKWFIPEEYEDIALRFTKSDLILLAPDLLLTEIANIFAMGMRTERVTRWQSIESVWSLSISGVKFQDTKSLIQSAFDLACEYKQTVYDCLYLALAIREQSVMVTADEKLVNALRKTPLEGYVVSLRSL